MIGLENVVAVVTGAAGGIGRAVVTAMKAAGAAVVATDRVDDPGNLGADHYLKHDVVSESDWHAVGALVRAEYGRLDALVNNAGISIVGKIEDTPLAEWHRVNAINVDSMIIGVQVLLPLLKGGRQGAPRRSVDRQFLQCGRLARSGVQRGLLHQQGRGKNIVQVPWAPSSPRLATTSAATAYIRAGSTRPC